MKFYKHKVTTISNNNSQFSIYLPQRYSDVKF